jgi:hypothetical protein
MQNTQYIIGPLRIIRQKNKLEKLIDKITVQDRSLFKGYQILTME